VFFVAPLWLCVVVPILIAPMPLGAALVIRQRRAPAILAACMAIIGLAMAVGLGGGLFAGIGAAFVLVTHRAGLSIADLVGASNSDRSWTRSRARLVLTMTVAGQIGLSAAMARGAFVSGPLSRISGMIVPFGVSYFAFHGISYLVDVYRRRSAPENSIFRLAVYLILLPLVIAGPISFEATAPHLARRLPNVSDYSFGVRRLVIGVWKVFVMAALAASQADAVSALQPERLSVLQAWVGLASFTLRMYYSFSGYADMGLGLGRMLGIRLPENFRWPLVAESVGEFWRRWHLGLSAWFREYATVSIERDRVPPPSMATEALIVLLCGIWYGLGWTFVAWGVYHALLIAAEHSGLEAVIRRLPSILRHVYLIFAVSLGFVLLRSTTLADAWLFLRALAGANHPGSAARLTFGYDVWVMLAAGGVGCAPLSPIVRRWTVVIDALIVSGLMALFASVLFTWRGARLVTEPVIRFWRGSPGSAGRS
jgi:alginate O-acetyltransferase complex protein AlgI